MKKFVVASPDNIENVGMKIFNDLSKFVFECVADLDLASLYPSIMRALNISIETCIGKIYYEENEGSGEDLLQDYMSKDVLSFGHKYMNLPSVDDMVEYIEELKMNGEI